MSARPGSRHQARIYALQALYHVDLATVRAQPGLHALWDTLMDGEGVDGERAPESEEIEFAQRMVRGVEERREEIDALIEQCSTNWRLRRMPIVDRNILRLAAYELVACPDIPANVSVNEAIELAKSFGTEESRAFVNGIVDRIGRQVGRLSAEPRRRRDEG